MSYFWVDSIAAFAIAKDWARGNGRRSDLIPTCPVHRRCVHPDLGIARDLGAVGVIAGVPTSRSTDVDGDSWKRDALHWPRTASAHRARPGTRVGLCLPWTSPATTPSNTTSFTDHALLQCQTMYLESAELRDRWVETIRVASLDFKFTEHYHISSLVHPHLPNVFECIGALTGNHYVVKYIDKITIKKTDLPSLRIESAGLRFVDAPMIAKTVALYEDQDKIYIFRHFIHHRIRVDEVIDCHAVLSANSVASIIRQVLSGLDFLLSRQITLGAFGPANIILCLDSLRKHHVQMVDIESRKYIGPPPPDSSYMRSFVAPEIEKGARYGLKADLWSVGAMIYCLLTPGSTPNDLTLAKHGGILDLSRTQGSDDLREVLKRLLHRNPAKRECAKDILRRKFIESAVTGPFHFYLKKRSDLLKHLESSYYDGA